MSKEIELTRGLVAIVDDEDYERFSQFNWQALSGGTKYYASRNVNCGGKYTHEALHRLIMNAPNNLDVDHIDGNTLDCRKSNLRFATKVQNAINRRIRSDNTSGYTGVSWNERDRIYLAFISVNKKLVRLGTFTSFDEAKSVREEAEREHYGKFTRAKDRLVEEIQEAKKDNPPRQLYRNSVHNQSGRKGVSYCKGMKAWRARISRNHKEENLGYFPTVYEACAAREAAERKYFPQFFEEQQISRT